MKYYLIAGESSGDMHAANLMRSLQQKDPEAEFRYYGGDRMQEAGGTLVRHYKTLAYMGFVEVASHIGTILRGIRDCRRDVMQYRPDVLIAVDYPDFNMRVARYVHKRGIRTVYYIAPQVWAWRTHRIKKLKKHFDRIFTLLPFERRFYEKYKAECFYEGNPLVDAVRAYEPDRAFIEEFRAKGGGKPLAVLLPGSRRQELERIFPTMLKVAASLPQYRYAVAGVRSLPLELYKKYMAAYPQMELVFDHTYDLFAMAQAGMIKSGTSTLEAALFSLPQVVCYRTHPVSYRLARLLVNKDVKFISLVNLILNREAVKELLQGDFTEENLKRGFLAVSEPGSQKSYQQDNYKELQTIMGEGGTCSRVADSIISFLVRL